MFRDGGFQTWRTDLSGGTHTAFQEEEKDGQWLCQEGIKFFKGHALKHFGSEERYMDSIHYPGLEQHRQVHKSFREYTLPALEEELERTEYAPDSVEHFLGAGTVRVRFRCHGTFPGRLRRLADRTYPDGGSCNYRKR